MKLIPWKKLLIPLLILPFIVLLAYGLTKDPRAIPSPLVRKEAPTFVLETLNDGKINLADLKGKVVLVNFWASWCFPACWNEAPRLEAAWEKYKDRGVMIVGIVYQDSEQNAREFIKRFNKTYPNGLDKRSRIAIDYGVYGVPETFFIDKQGKIAHKHTGELTEEVLTKQIEELL